MTETIKLRENLPKIIFSIAYIIHYAAKARGKKPSQYDIVKSLFLADRQHMNRFGRPITFDNYVALKHGPVPSLSYDILKGSQRAIKRMKGRKMPWKVTKTSKYNEYHDSQINDFGIHLSDSDIEALEGAYETVFTLGFHLIRKITHEDRSYVEAWKDHPTKKQFKMRLDLLFDEPSREEALRVSEISQFA